MILIKMLGRGTGKDYISTSCSICTLIFLYPPVCGEVVLVGAHIGTLAPEEVPGEPVGDEADRQLVAVARAAALARPQPRPELRAEGVRAAQLELARVLHLRQPGQFTSGGTENGNGKFLPPISTRSLEPSSFPINIHYYTRKVNI